MEELEYKVCPDCEKEGRGEPQPPGAFYTHKRRRKDGSYHHFLSVYCKKHQTTRNVARTAERLKTDPAAREKKRAADRRYSERHRPEIAAKIQRWRKRHPERAAAYYEVHRRYVERNRQQRRAKQAAWYKRKKAAREGNSEE